MSKPNVEDMRVLCANVGAAVFACQAAEKLINSSLLLLFPKEPIRTVEMIEQLEKQHRRKTLGQFIRARMDRGGQECPVFFSAGYFSGLLTHSHICAHRRSIFLLSLERAHAFPRVRVGVARLLLQI
jgi:hypothetical protein